MFQENVEEINQQNKTASIESGDYTAEVSNVTTISGKNGKHGAFIVTFAISEGDNEGCEYTFFLTHSPKASGIRSGFYRAVGYEVPSDGQIDENEWTGLKAKVTIKRNDNGEPVVGKVAALPVNSEDTPF